MRSNFFGKLIIALSIFSLCGGYAFAQGVHEIKFKGTFPFGDFKKISETKEMENDIIKSGAAVGAGIGYRYHFNIASGLGLTIGGDILWNMTKKKYRDICKDPIPEDTIPPINQTPPQYLNFPFVVGVNYRLPLGSSNNWFAFFGAYGGLNVHYTTSTGWKNFEVRYKPVLSPCLSLEAGFNYRQYSLSIELMTLGQPTITGNGNEDFQCFHILDKKRDMLLGNIVFSYKLIKQKREWKPTRKTILEL